MDLTKLIPETQGILRTSFVSVDFLILSTIFIRLVDKRGMMMNSWSFCL